MVMVSSTLLLLLPLAVTAANPKRGIAYPQEVKAPLNKIPATSQISWEYNWGKPAPAGLPAGIQHVPMQWDERDIANLPSQIGSARVLLGFNEPERGDQAAISPGDAANLWKTQIMKVPASVRLGGPAVSAGPTGQQWLRDFFAACNGGCRVDFLPIHWYGEGAANFNKYVSDMHTMFNKPIWVTEFAPTGGDAVAFMRDTLKFLDSTSYVERYAWFAYAPTPVRGLNTGLLDGNNNINNLGNIYIKGA
ncbi:hypothetical protein E1B28_006495 [Marasmius oreades]|uniref:Asl1-like glycosyl hydrolase catalytic domain-containing protein n=1 Tax=Marasmius oreades TaxID=181124 RepID=A0A9P7UVT2_9AGAR|nr:uncharacterized protein E1B28_006495 [Marasmius oreades]KAG7095795.1 hypothetical protein E1B28_006495 [Marasmius oreades]